MTDENEAILIKTGWGGTTHLSVDLGLVETLPAIKAAAMDELETALVIHLPSNSYTA